MSGRGFVLVSAASLTSLFASACLAPLRAATSANDVASAVEIHAGQQLTSAPNGFEFINTSFENASPLWYDFDRDETINIHLLYDLERSSPNRAAGHFHFLLQGKPGSHLTVEFKNLDNVWNGQPGSIAGELKAAVISEDGRTWKPVLLKNIPGNRVQLEVEMPGSKLYIARVEPYRLSDLHQLLTAIRTNRLVQITPIGKTVEDLALEIIRIGDPGAPYRVFLRARAHPWEAGSSWVIEGLVRRLLLDDESSRKYLGRYCVYILPMANKDGVAHGRTRFNSQGKDLNRDWDKPIDPILAPENYCLQTWLQQMIAEGRRPNLAIELHNDGHGQLHISRPLVPQLKGYLERMAVLERLLRQNTWFTEGSTPASFHNSGTLGDGWLERYGIDGAVHELNCNWIEGLNDYPSAQHWKQYGADLAKVFYEYFGLLR